MKLLRRTRTVSTRFAPWLIALMSLITSLSACRIECNEARGIEGAGLTIKFFHTANNQYFYTQNPNLSPFRLDSLRVLDSKRKLLRTPYGPTVDPRDQLSTIYAVSIYPIFIPSDDDSAFEVEKSKWIYIYYNRTISDTLKLVYKARKGKCANQFEYLKAYRRNNLLAESFNTYHENLEFTLNH